MQLALFTPGSYVWPVLRNFEVFIARLAAEPQVGGPLLAARTLGEVATAEKKGALTIYPVGLPSDMEQYQIDPRMSRRLERLHRELYDALLQPSSFFITSSRGIAESFWPDLTGTLIERKLEAFFFYYLRRTIRHVSLLEGLAVLRATFFNHEAVEPEHWLHTTQERLGSLAATDPLLDITFDAPASTRVDDLAFVLNTDQDRPPNSAAWITGKLKRGKDGLVHIYAQCGVDPWLVQNPGELESARPYIEAEVQASVSYIFGWEPIVPEAD
jgi:hypothetical protein